MSKAYIDKVGHIPFNESLQNRCFEEIKFPNRSTGFILTENDKEKVQDQTYQDVLRNSINKEGESSPNHDP